jgi:hypothetical protein
MFNLKEDLSVVARNVLSDGNAMLREQREALTADIEVKARALSDVALTRFGKVIILAASLVTAGLFAVAAALIFAK